MHEISNIAVVAIDKAVELMAYDDMRQVLIKADKWLTKQMGNHSGI